MILITGITGTTGMELANLISKTNVKVRAIVRDTSRTAFLEKMGIEIVSGNLENRDTIRSAVNGVQKIFLLTANNPQQVEQEKNLIDVSYESNVKHIVKFSIIGANANSKCEILKRHSTSERNLENSNINYTFIRPNIFMQNLLMFANVIKKKGEFYFPLKTTHCGFVNLRDVAKVIVRILLDENIKKYNKRIYTLTGPDLLSCKDVAEIFSEYLHKRVNYINVSEKEFIEILQKFKFKKIIAEDYANLFTLAGEGLFDKKTSDILEITGTIPGSFENFVVGNIEYFN